MLDLFWNLIEQTNYKRPFLRQFRKFELQQLHDTEEL